MFGAFPVLQNLSEPGDPTPSIALMTVARHTHSTGAYMHKGISAEPGCSPRLTAPSKPCCWEVGGVAGTLQLGSPNSSLWCLAAKRRALIWPGSLTPPL